MSIFAQLGMQDTKGRLYEEALYNLAACYGLAERRVSQALKRFRLSAVTMNALLIIKHIGTGQGLSQADIGKRMIVSAGNITRLLDRLEEQGWVRRFASDEDRRIKRVRITRSGSELLDRAWPHYLKSVEGIVSILPREQVRDVTQVLDRFRRGLSQKAKENAV